MLERKPIPPRTLEHLLPPNLDYAYFEAAGERPFRGEIAPFDLVNATWLADAALLAYADEEFSRREWGKAGVSDVRVFKGASTSAAVAATERWIIVAFRGTQVVRPDTPTDGENTWSAVFRDWKTDADIKLVTWPRGGRVHRGFRDALEQVWEDHDGHQGLMAYLQEAEAARSAVRPVWFTGHSLGAALAILAAHAYGPAAGVYTFGSPRVGTREFTMSRTMPIYRVVNSTDLVTRIPPVPFEPSGELHYIDATGHLGGAPSVLGRLTDWVTGTARGLVPGFSALADHAPLFYATYVWNACVEHDDGEPHREA